ncbi:MAG: chromate transporter [Firmicutes bacterium]|nr:chromate transporter [Bacillota bacterium]
MKELIKLYLVFFRIGITTFGGGYALLPILQRELVEQRGWATDEELMDYFAIGQCTPGIISVNTATFIGYQRAGATGGILATLGFVTPSLIVITIIAALIQNFADYRIVQNAFAGIRAGVCAISLHAIIKLWKNAVVDKTTLLIFMTVMVLSFVLSVSPVFMVMGAGIFGIIINFIRAKKIKGGND